MVVVCWRALVSLSDALTGSGSGTAHHAQLCQSSIAFDTLFCGGLCVLYGGLRAAGVPGWAPPAVTGGFTSAAVPAQLRDAGGGGGGGRLSARRLGLVLGGAAFALILLPLLSLGGVAAILAVLELSDSPHVGGQDCSDAGDVSGRKTREKRGKSN